MKKNFLTIFALFFIMFASALAQDTVVVNPDPVGSFGALNNAIANDTRPAKRVYKLKRGGFYVTNGRISTNNYPDFHLRIVGEGAPATGTDPGPAVIQAGVKSDGSVDGTMLEMWSDVTLKNIWFLFFDINGGQNWAPLLFQKEKIRAVADNCIFEWMISPAIQVEAAGARLFFTNCMFRNAIDRTQWWAGRMVYINNAAGCDTIFCENNTFENVGFAWQNQSHYCGYLWFNHNTFVNVAKFAFMTESSTNAIVTNNVFYNCHFTGERIQDRQGQDPGGLLWGTVLDLYPLSADQIAAWGIKEAQRRIILYNNSNYLDPAFNTFYTNYNNDPLNLELILAEPIMNNRTQSMFNSAEYPKAKSGNLIDKENPNFIKPPGNLQLMLNWLTDRYSSSPVNTIYWGWDPDDPLFENAVQLTKYPLPENLKFTNTKLLTAATNGFPLGDLNWFPDKIGPWQAQAPAERDAINKLVSTGVKELAKGVPEQYRLENNYPNPFNPVTTIEYSLPHSGFVSLKVYNLIGEEVATLVNGIQHAGQFEVPFDASNLSSGVYIYRLQSNNFIETKRMVLMK
jgi:hypothetical protein